MFSKKKKRKKERKEEKVARKSLCFCFVLFLNWAFFWKKKKKNNNNNKIIFDRPTQLIQKLSFLQAAQQFPPPF